MYFLFLKEPMRIRASLCLKKALRLSARNSYVKFDICLRYLAVIIINAFEK